MDFSVDIHSELNGELTIEDLSREYLQYIDEDLDVTTSFDLFKYSQTASLNTLLKITMKEAILIDVVVNDHSEYLDTAKFKINEDGYYIINHFVLPNLEWYNTASEEYKNYYEFIYVTDGEKLYKEIDGELEECTVRELLERNIEGTTILKCKIETFYTGHLQQCYINYCKKIFDLLLNKCQEPEHNNDIFARDFIWMTLNIIDYLIGFKQFREAERILSNFRTCGNFCNMRSDIKHISCGCS